MAHQECEKITKVYKYIFEGNSHPALNVEVAEMRTDLNRIGRKIDRICAGVWLVVGGVLIWLLQTFIADWWNSKHLIVKSVVGQ